MNSVRFLSVFVLILCMSLTIAGPARTFAQLAQKTSEERMKSQRSIRAPYSNSGESCFKLINLLWFIYHIYTQ